MTFRWDERTEGLWLEVDTGNRVHHIARVFESHYSWRYLVFTMRMGDVISRNAPTKERAMSEAKTWAIKVLDETAAESAACAGILRGAA